MNRFISSEKHKTIKTYDSNKNSMTLRDFLALDRTILANERTVLAWVRTGLSILIAGITFIKYINDTLFRLIGYGFVTFGMVVLGLGTFRYNRLSQKLKKLREL